MFFGGGGGGVLTLFTAVFNFPPNQTIRNIGSGQIWLEIREDLWKIVNISQTCGTDFLLIDRLVSAATNSRIMGGGAAEEDDGQSRSDGGKFH